MNPTIFACLISAALSGGAGALATWKWQASTITQMELDHANERIARDRANRTQIERVVAAHAAAQAKEANSLILSVADRAAVDRVALGLRDTTAAVVRACADDPATCPRKAAALGIVFDRCAAAAVGMGSDAQGWVIEAVKQHDSNKE